MTPMSAFPMAAGSVIGAVLGGLLLGIVAATAIKVGLAVILVVSAARVLRRSRAA